MAYRSNSMNYNMMVYSSGKGLADLVKEANSPQKNSAPVNQNTVNSVQYNKEDKKKYIERLKRSQAMSYN
jgi:hypothetical protein